MLGRCRAAPPFHELLRAMAAAGVEPTVRAAVGPLMQQFTRRSCRSLRSGAQWKQQDMTVPIRPYDPI
jgi:hypothetical protein